MPKAGEQSYFSAIGKENALGTIHKPFSVSDRGPLLAQIGAILSLLPSKPAKILDLGCGTGWTSVMIARSGYTVVGQDISQEAIALANKYQLSKNYQLSFTASDYESMAYDAEFDGAVFFDCLHHAEDEVAALKSVYRCLKPGGIVVISEPGKGHAASAQAKEARQKFGVTEKDMPPTTVIAAAKKAGFTSFSVYPDIGLIQKALYRSSFNSNQKLGMLIKIPGMRFLIVLYIMARKRERQGIVVLQKL